MGSKKKKKQQAKVHNKEVVGKQEGKEGLQKTSAGVTEKKAEVVPVMKEEKKAESLSAVKEEMKQESVAVAKEQESEVVQPVGNVTEKGPVSESRTIAGSSETVTNCVATEEAAKENLPTPKRRGSFFGLLFGILLTAALVWLVVCFYQTSAELQAVQAFSGGLQTKLKATEEKLDALSREVKTVQSATSVSEPVSDEAPEELPSVTKKPHPTPPPEVYTVCIDAGHGAHDPGAVLELEDGTERKEKDDNLWFSKLVRKELEAYGVKVVMTREDDSFLELYDRTLTANSLDVDALISFHRNAYYSNGEMSDKVTGVEIWIHSSRPTEARRLANRMLDAILDTGDMEDRGVRYGSMSDYNEDYAINRRALMTSMIVEMGFISSEKDNEDFDTNGEAYAKAIAKEIYDWLIQQ